MDSTVCLDVLALMDALLAAGRCRGAFEAGGSYCLAGAMNASLQEMVGRARLNREKQPAVAWQLALLLKGCLEDQGRPEGLMEYSDALDTTDADLRSLISDGVQRLVGGGQRAAAESPGDVPAL